MPLHDVGFSIAFATSFIQIGAGKTVRWRIIPSEYTRLNINLYIAAFCVSWLFAASIIIEYVLTDYSATSFVRISKRICNYRNGGIVDFFGNLHSGIIYR